MSKRLGIPAAAVLLLLGFSRATAFAQQPEEPKPAPPAAPVAPAPQAEAPVCSDCHDEAKQFKLNPHARGQVKKGEVSSDVCATCHGDGTEHAASGGDKTKINKPVGLKGSEETCMLCHDVATDRIARHSGVHANTQATNCLTCHSIHHSNPTAPHLVAQPQLVLCGSCHTQAASLRNKPYAHRVGRGGMECSSCHEPHGLPGRQNLRLTRAGELPCLGCHSDKRGPYVFNHGSLALRDCTVCHEPHGSSNPKMLTRANVWQLCIECHSPITNDTLGSQPPSFHNLNSPRFQNCTTCHVAVHGSNRDPQLLK